MSSKTKKVGKSKIDDLYSKVSSKVMTDSLHIKQGESVTIETWNTGLELAKQLVKDAKKLGAFPILIIEDEDAYVYGIKNSPKEMIGKMGKHEYALLSGTDAYVFIPGPPIGAYSPMMTKEEASTATGYNVSWYEAANKAKLRGARLAFGYVGKDLSKLLGKKIDDIVQTQLKACLVDFASLSTKGREIAQNLQDESKATLTSDGSKLEFTVKGETSVEDGIIDEQDIAEGNNMGYLPSGMVQKEIDPTSVTGSVKISDSVTRSGLVSDATLHFENGVLTTWKAPPKAKKVLDQILGSAPESNRKAKIITIGFNPEMKFGYAQDRFVSGSIGVGGFGFTGIVQRGSLVVGDKSLVQKGKIA